MHLKQASLLSKKWGAPHTLNNYEKIKIYQYEQIKIFLILIIGQMPG